MKVVLPDADEQCAIILSEYDVQVHLQQFTVFKMFTGRPHNISEYLERVFDADVIISWWGLPKEVIVECPKLKMISFAGTGYKNFIDAEFAAQHGVKVANATRYGDNAVAEHALTLMLSLLKKIPTYHQSTLAGKWERLSPNIEFNRKTIGIVGLGGIGSRMAELCKALGMNVICWTFNPDKEREQKLGVKFVDIEYLLSKSDIVSLHLPYTEKTRGFIGENEIRLMKDGSIFINTARAELVHTPSLVKYISMGKFAGAGIDVFDEEPISVGNPILELENVILTPHVAYHTREATKNLIIETLTNAIRFIKGNPTNIVN